MQVFTSIDGAGPFTGGVVSIGNFDGVHRGHQAMLAELVSLARELEVPAVAMTFDPPPVALIAPQKVPPRLSTVQRKAELMALQGVDYLLVYPTSREFLNLSPGEFFSVIIEQQLQARGLVEGENFCFGKGRAGDSRTLQEFCGQRGMPLRLVEAIREGNETISSTRIRQYIAGGNIERAVDWLGHAYRVTGRVVAGAQRGRQLGFPTANLSEVTTLLPTPGVYAGACEFGERHVPAAVHIGHNPTFAENQLKIEVHLIGQQVSLYGELLSVDLFAHCRATQQFDNGAALRSQLEQDIALINQLFLNYFGPVG